MDVLLRFNAPEQFPEPYRTEYLENLGRVVRGDRQYWESVWITVNGIMTWQTEDITFLDPADIQSQLDRIEGEVRGMRAELRRALNIRPGD